MGVVAALLVSTGHPTQTGDKLPIPLWVAVLAASVIALGTLSGGWRIVRTMGLRTTRLRPVSGFSAETGAAIALFGSTPNGAPVSTTHTVAGAVSGVGTANRGTTTNWSVFGRMAVAWLVTMPFAGLVGYLVWHLAMLSNRPASVVIMTVIVVGLVAILAVAIRPTSRSDAFRPDRKPEKVPSRLPPPADHVLGRAVDGVRRAAPTAG
jgi:PiT family inorganic phosphate transporter